MSGPCQYPGTSPTPSDGIGHTVRDPRTGRWRQLVEELPSRGLLQSESATQKSSSPGSHPGQHLQANRADALPNSIPTRARSFDAILMPSGLDATIAILYTFLVFNPLPAIELAAC